MSIVVIGAVFVDIKGYPSRTYIPGGRNAGKVRYVHGGVSRNIAEDLGNLGLDPVFLSLVDPNGAGEDVLMRLREHGVDTRYIRRIPGGRSSTSVVMVDPNKGTRTKFPYRDALPPLIFDDEQRRAIEGCRVLHLDGTRYENAIRAAGIARAAGVTVSLDGCSRQQDNDLNIALARMADILIMNAVYPFKVSGACDIPGALKFFAGLGPKKVVAMTVGREGCWALIGGEAVRFPAFKVDAADTTGAGDVFHGAFLARWLETDDIGECIRFASAAAAMKCRVPGGRRGIPTREALESFLREA